MMIGERDALLVEVDVGLVAFAREQDVPWVQPNTIRDRNGTCWEELAPPRRPRQCLAFLLGQTQTPRHASA
jgi:hypothetical protein